jgi:hypothetical protein
MSHDLNVSSHCHFNFQTPLDARSARRTSGWSESAFELKEKDCQRIDIVYFWMVYTTINWWKRLLMCVVSADAINYSISSNGVATVQSFACCVSIVLPRNSVPFDGKLFGVSVFRPVHVQDSLDTVLIPRSIRRIYDNVFSSKSFSASLAFELWSELEWIGPSAFQYSRLQYRFLPQSVDFIGSFGFANCESVVCVYFQSHSSLWQLKSQNFTGLSKLRAITIPVSIRQIHRRAFSSCKSLSCVTFESRSQCWYISFDAFSNCPRLQSFFLPPSLEVIDSSESTLSSPLLRFNPSDGSHFCVENDCLVRIADQNWFYIWALLRLFLLVLTFQLSPKTVSPETINLRRVPIFGPWGRPGDSRICQNRQLFDRMTTKRGVFKFENVLDRNFEGPFNSSLE